MCRRARASVASGFVGKPCKIPAAPAAAQAWTCTRGFAFCWLLGFSWLLDLARPRRLGNSGHDFLLSDRDFRGEWTGHLQDGDRTRQFVLNALEVGHKMNRRPLVALFTTCHGSPVRGACMTVHVVSTIYRAGSRACTCFRSRTSLLSFVRADAAPTFHVHGLLFPLLDACGCHISEFRYVQTPPMLRTWVGRLRTRV